jgi:hypothetical protein
MRRLIEVLIKGCFKEVVAEIAVFILGLALSAKVNANDSPAFNST